MDVGNKEKLEAEKRNESSSVSYHTPQLPSDCRFAGANFANSSIGMIADGNAMAASKGDLADSYGPVVWDHPSNSQPYNSLNPIGLAGGISGSLRVRPDFLMPAVSGNFPHLSQLPADSDFIQRAARFSSFNSGNFADLMNSFPMNQSVDPYHHLASMPQKNDPNPNPNPPSTSKGETKQTESDEAESVGGYGQEETSLMDISTEPSLPKGVGPKKRRRAVQDTEPEQSRQQSGEAANDNAKFSSTPPKTTGKNGKSNSQTSDPPKDEYIHVRARRGQATNSHSLAERIRREKISERMKFLQDLVPGCSKVTGKAVMLDEIINYVQSLQRQVEFLSMKLATVDPRVDFNIDSLLAKEPLFPTLVGPSSSLGYSPDVSMAYPPMHPSQPTGIHPSLPVIGHSSDVLRSLHPPQLTAINEGFKESTQQMPNVWDYELQNVVQMGFDHSAPLENQETNSSLPPTHTKAEP